MLQMMQNKVTAEGKKAEAIYDKFMCYCDNADTLLGGAITAAENKIPQLEAAIGGDLAEKTQLEADLKAHKADQAAAKEAIAKATGIRNKDAGVYANESGDLKTNIAALAKATAAIEKGVTGFLQTSPQACSAPLRSKRLTFQMLRVRNCWLFCLAAQRTATCPNLAKSSES